MATRKLPRPSAASKSKVKKVASPGEPRVAPKAVAPVRLPIRRHIFGLRLWPDSLILLVLFGLSLLLLYLTYGPDGKPAATSAPLITDQAAPEGEPLPDTGDFQTDITLTSPTANAVFRSGDLISGAARVYGGSLYYRVVESTGRILTTGVVQTQDPAAKSAFEARPTGFVAGTATGRIEVYGFSSKEGEAGKRTVSVRFR